MKSPADTPVTDDEIHTLVDGQAPPDTLMALQNRLNASADDLERFKRWQQQRNALRQLHLGVLEEAVPPTLLQAAQRTQSAHDTNHQWSRYGGMAASVVLAFGTGWLANSSWQASTSPQRNASGIMQAQLEHDFVRQASVAHSVFAPEVRHPVEVTALEQAHLVQWLSKRLGKPLKVPDLTAQGFELVGGRLLPGSSGARAQFMFQNTAGSRITLYLGAVDGAATPGLSDQETEFRYEPHAAVPSFYWVDQGFGYALSGQLPREVLMGLANAVYRQL